MSFSPTGKPNKQPQLTSPCHHLPAGICGFFGGGKNIKFYFPATTEQNITRVKLFRKPSDSSILMTIELSYHLLLSSLVGIDVVRTPDLGRGGAHQANF
jgi:hypothetical protein